ncbi:hypothetical protein [Aquitalea pelogenes]|uniref:hypothetical protein n=1 Tax=Aquitalea pelogenes TaxID=1293573 RepID=UPI0035B30C6F
MAKIGRPKKHNDLVQFNLYIERHDLEILKEVVNRLNDKHQTSDFTLAGYTRKIFSTAARGLEEKMKIHDQKVDAHKTELASAAEQFTWKPKDGD